MSIAALLLAATLFVAWSNGANDNFKGVATLYGSGTLGYRAALAWGTLTTLAGSLASIALAHRLVAAFSGKGLVPDVVAATPAFLAAVALGAAATVFGATRLGLPVSTTHALIGALVGAGTVVGGGLPDLDLLARRFLVPLAASPVLAITAAGVLYPPLRWLRRRLGVTRAWCVCVGKTEQWLPRPALGVVLAASAAPRWGFSAGPAARCAERYDGRLFGIEAQRLLDAAHVASAGAVSFARGLNDTPKIVGLLVVLAGLRVEGSLLLVALAIAAGGVVQARRVAETLSRRITTMNHGQGFTANAVTALLVLGASRLGMPVSTTHVSCGALFGIGAVSGRARVATIATIVTAWIVTLPAAALLAGLTAGLLTG